MCRRIVAASRRQAAGGTRQAAPMIRICSGACACQNVPSWQPVEMCTTDRIRQLVTQRGHDRLERVRLPDVDVRRQRADAPARASTSP